MYKKRYECFCKSIEGDLFRIEIYKRGFHVSEEVRLGEDMLVIERTAEDQLDPISVTKATVFLYTERDGLFEDLYSFGEHGAICRIFKNDTLYYIGSLDAEQWKAPYSYKQGYITQVTFSDLSPLKRLEYAPHGLVSVVDFVKQCITKATYPDSLFGKPTLQLLTNLSVSGYKHQWDSLISADLSNISALTSSERLSIAEGSLSTLNPIKEVSSLSRAYIDTAVFLDEDKGGDDERKAVWWNALQDALKSLSLYLVQRDGKFYLFDVDALKERGAKETLVAMGNDAELGIEKTYNKIKVELEKREPTNLYKHKFSENDFGTEVTNWRFNRIDLEAGRLVASHNVVFHTPKSDETIRGGALYAQLIPHTMGREETYVCLFAKPRRSYEHNPVVGSFYHELAHTFPFAKPYPIEKMADIRNLQGENGVYCTPMIPLPTRTADNLAKYQMALSLEMLVGMDYSLTQKNSDDPEYDKAIGKHIKKIIPKKIQHAYAFAYIRAYDKRGNVVKYLSNYGGVPTDKQPFYRPVWVDTPTSCCIQFGAEEFKLGSFQNPNEQVSTMDISTKYGEVYDRRFIFPLPPVGYSIDVVVIDKIHLSLQEPKYNFFTSLNDLVRKDEEEAKLRILQESYVQWVLMRGLAVDLVRYDGKDFEHKKVVYRSSVSPEAHEELEETILLDTSKELSPTSLSALRDKEGRNLSHECTRGLVRGSLGELRVFHVFSRCSHLHYTLSGTYRTPNTFSKLVDPHKKKEFRVVEETEEPLLGQSKLSLVEINRDRATDGGSLYDILCIGVGDAEWSVAHRFDGRLTGDAYKESIEPVTLISGLVAEQEAVAYELSQTRQELTQELAKKQPVGSYATTVQLDGVQKFAIRPSNADVVGSSTNNPFAPILDPNGESKVISLDIVEGTDLYLPPARLCAVGTKIFLRGSTMSCPTNPYHHNTTIRPIRIFSNERDVYSAGRYYSGNNLVETFTNAEWRVDLECIIAGCGLKGWFWVNSVECKNLSEFTSSITTAIQGIAEAKQEINRLKNSVLRKGEGIISGFYNLRNSSTGTYTVKATDYHILARTTANGDTYPYIRVDNSLPVGHQFIVDIPFSECRVRLVLPSVATTWGNGGTEWTHGYRYHVTKSWSNEWGVVKTAYAQ